MAGAGSGAQRVACLIATSVWLRRVGGRQSRLFSAMGIALSDQIRRRPALQHRRNARQHQPPHRIPRLHRVAAEMRQQHDILQCRFQKTIAVAVE
jgi:hypothetical protein